MLGVRIFWADTKGLVTLDEHGVYDPDSVSHQLGAAAGLDGDGLGAAAAVAFAKVAAAFGGERSAGLGQVQAGAGVTVMLCLGGCARGPRHGIGEVLGRRH